MRIRCLLAFVCLPLAVSNALAEAQKPEKWQPWLEIGGIGSNIQSRGETALWVPIFQSLNSIFFTEVQGKLFEDDQREGNFAIGYRQMMPGGTNLGFWLGYDARRTSFTTNVGQVAAGIEALSSNWDFRANAYAPTSTSQVISLSSTTTAIGSTQPPILQFQNNQLFLVSGGQTTTSTMTTETRELDLWGIDGEFGLKLPTNITNVIENELRLYAGAYYFDNEYLSQPLVGPKLRLEWRFDDVIPDWSGSRLTLNASFQWDDTRDDQLEAGLTLRLPFGGQQSGVTTPSAQERRMSDGIVRDTNVITVAATTSHAVTSTSGNPEIREAVKDAETGTTLDHALIVSNGTDLQAAITSVGSNALIVAQGGASTFGGVTLHANQSLVGGGSVLQVRGVTSGILVDYTAPGSRPMISETAGSGITVDSNTHVLGFDITGIGHFHVPANNGIQGGSNQQNIVINDVNVNNVGNQGVAFDSSNTNVRILNSTFTNVADGVSFQQDNTNITVAHVTVSNTLFDGIVFQRTNSNIHVTDNQLSNIGDDAIGGMGGNQIEYSRNTFSGHISDNMLDIFLTNGNAYSGSGNVLASGLTVGGALCNQSAGPPFTGSFSFTNGTVFQAGVAPCN